MLVQFCYGYRWQKCHNTYAKLVLKQKDYRFAYQIKISLAWLQFYMQPCWHLCPTSLRFLVSCAFWLSFDKYATKFNLLVSLHSLLIIYVILTYMWKLVANISSGTVLSHIHTRAYRCTCTSHILYRGIHLPRDPSADQRK